VVSAGVFGNAYDLVLERSNSIAYEILADGILILEKLPSKSLIDDCHVA
jgi:hypothetical protein